MPLTGPARPCPKPVTRGGISRSKPPSVKRASKAKWAELYAIRIGACLVCRFLGEKQTLRSSLHHIIAKSIGGADEPENLAPTCGDGTTGHHGLLEAHDPDTCRVFLAALKRFDPDCFQYAIDQIGPDRLARRYHVDLKEAQRA